MMRSRLVPNSKILALVVHRDADQWLAQSLQSLEDQTRPPDATVVLATGRTGPARAVAQRFPGVTVVPCPGPDVGSVLDELLGDTTFDGYLLQRSEDWAAPGRLEQLLAATLDAQADGAVSSHLVVDPSGPSCTVFGRPRGLVEPGAERVLLGAALLSTEAFCDILEAIRAESDPGERARVVAIAAGRLASCGDVLCHRRACGDDLVTSLVPERSVRRRGRRRPLPALPSGPGRRRGSRSRRGSPERAPGPPLFVVAADIEEARVVAWALAQHPRMLPVRDVGWLVTLARDAARTANGPDEGSRSPNRFDGFLASARAGFEHAVWHAGTASAAARAATGHERRWVAALPNEKDALAAAATVYPDAAWVHVVGAARDQLGPSNERAQWAEATASILEISRWLSRDRCLRIETAELLREPAAVLRRCLDLAGEGDDPRCAGLLTGMTGGEVRPAEPGAEFDMIDALRVALLPPGKPTGGGVAETPGALTELLLRSTPPVSGFSAPELELHAPRPADPPQRTRPTTGAPRRRAQVAIDAAGSRQLVERHVPAGAVVCVVSRGDEHLLALGEAEGWHFPRSESGEWSGQYPADGDEAVAHLERLRHGGAEFLLVPTAYRWWLEHYRELRSYLESRCRVAEVDPRGGVLFDLRRPGNGSALSLPAPIAERTAPDEAQPLKARVIGGTEARSAAPKSSAHPSVTAIVTAYNVEGYVERSLRSLAEQTYPNLRILAIDDASTDGTRGVLERLANEIANLDVRFMHRNSGTYVCRNVALSAATGELVTFNDADDTSHPERIRRQVDRWQSAGGGNRLVVCDYQRVDADGKVLLNRGLPRRLSLQTMLVPREVFAEMGGFDSVRMSADAEFLDRFRSRYSREAVLHVDEALYCATAREGSLTAQAGAEAELGESAVDASRPVEEFLSQPRRLYLDAYRRWHVESGKQARLEFPIRARPFSAPREHTRDVPAPARVMAGMATHRQRRDVLEQAVASIAGQVDELHLHLNDYDDPPAGVCLPNVKITTASDHGDVNDIGKFLVLRQLTGTEYLFTVDDDIVYPTDYVSRMLALLEQFGRTVAVGVHAAVLASPLRRFYEGRSVAHFRRSAPHRYLADVIGTGTMAVHSSILPVSLDDFRAPGMADLWFAIGCKRSGTPRVVIDRAERWLLPLETETSIWSTHSRCDDVQTTAAKDAGDWGRAVLRREAESWAGDEYRDDFFWRSFGFDGAAGVVLPERRG